MKTKLSHRYLFLMLFVFSTEVLSAPSGRIASTLFDGPLGKILLVVTCVFFLPLILLRMFKTRRLSRKAFNYLNVLSKDSAMFEWINLKQFAQKSFHQVHQAWTKHDLSIVKNVLSSEFLVHSQVTYLDTWESRGLRNVCEIEKITKTFPLLVIHRDDDDIRYNNSMVIIYFEAEMKDYLIDKAKDIIVEGNNKVKSVASIWTFTVRNHDWQVTNIEDAGLLQDYLDIAKDQPPLTALVR